MSISCTGPQFAAERAELRARGAALDADIGRRERDVAALEATLRVLHHAHAHFLHHIAPLQPLGDNIDTLTLQKLQRIILRLIK